MWQFTKMWQFTMPGPLALRLISSWTSSVLFTMHVHCLACYGAHVNQQPELIAGVELFQIHVFSLIFVFHKEAVGLFPHVLAFDAVVVENVGRAVDCEADFLQIRDYVFF